MESQQEVDITVDRALRLFDALKGSTIVSSFARLLLCPRLRPTDFLLGLERLRCLRRRLRSMWHAPLQARRLCEPRGHWSASRPDRHDETSSPDLFDRTDCG